MFNPLPHTLLQVAQDLDGRLYVATSSPDGPMFETLPLVDGSEVARFQPLDANVTPVERPYWAIDFYTIAAWELACLQYDTIGS